MYARRYATIAMSRNNYLEEVGVARQLDSFPAVATQQYPWEEWLDGRAWQPTKGEDYTSKPTTIIQNARLQAKRRGGSVRTRLLQRDDAQHIVVQFRHQS